MNSLQPKPLICTFRELVDAMQALHLGDKAMIAELHDIWKYGAPIPQSIIRNPRHYDERKQQPGNYEARIVFPSKLAAWIMATSAKRGFPYSFRQSLNLALGEIDMGLED